MAAENLFGRVDTISPLEPRLFDYGGRSRKKTGNAFEIIHHIQTSRPDLGSGFRPTCNKLGGLACAGEIFIEPIAVVGA